MTLLFLCEESPTRDSVPPFPTSQGCHEFSSELYQSLRTRVASEHFYFWLNSLKEFSQAEQCLSRVADGDYSGAMSAIADALRSYQKGIASLTVSPRGLRRVPCAKLAF